MSEFAGPIKDFPGVSIDRFSGENRKPTVCFFSHCHTDHMVGLNEPELFEKLKHYNLKIYCHKVLAAFLSALQLYNHLTPYIKPLVSDNETTLNVSFEGDKTHNQTVTFIPADHCPVSVMFLQNSEEKNVFFTGNFRWQVGHTKRINHLFDTLQEGTVHNFDKITSTQRFAKHIPTSYLLGRAVFQPSFKRYPHGSVLFKIIWSIFATKLAKVMNF